MWNNFFFQILEKKKKDKRFEENYNSRCHNSCRKYNDATAGYNPVMQI